MRDAAFAQLAPAQLEIALGRADTLIRPDEDAYVDYFVKHHQKVQNFSKTFLSILTFCARGEDYGLLEGLGFIADIHAGSRRKLPADAPTRFVPKAWLPEVLTEKGLHWALT